MLHLHAFADMGPYARAIARRLGATLSRVRTHRFPDGETIVRVKSPPGSHAALVCSLHAPNGKLIAALLAADALRRAGAARVTLAAPYLPYMRQDAVFHDGEPVSQQVIGGVLGRAFDRLVTVEPHLHRTQSLAEAMPCEARSVSAAPALAGWVRRLSGDCLIVGPDEESERLVRPVAEAAGFAWIAGRKRRFGDRRVKIEFDRLPKASSAAVLDDIASSGATLAAAIGALKRAGVRTVDAAVVHALFAPGALDLIRRAGARRIVSCDTIRHPSNAIRTAALLAEALSEPR